MTEPKKTVYETSSDDLAQELFRVDPDAALSGSKLVSAEANVDTRDDWQASPNRKKSKMVFELASGQPERFLELVGFLPHIIQDIFYQYFLLGRTQTQIGRLLDMSQKNVWQALEVGVGGVAALIHFNGPPTIQMSSFKETARAGRVAWDAWQTVLEFRTSAEQRKELIVEESTKLGSFILSTSDETWEQNFAPSTPDGPAR
jgi:hypothetical protein